jgi:hypothetical protein
MAIWLSESRRICSARLEQPSWRNDCHSRVGGPANSGAKPAIVVVSQIV